MRSRSINIQYKIETYFIEIIPDDYTARSSKATKGTFPAGSRPERVTLRSLASLQQLREFPGVCEALGASAVCLSLFSRLFAEQRGPVGLAGLRLPRNAVPGAGVGLAAAPFRTSSPQLLGVSNWKRLRPQLAPSLFLDFCVTCSDTCRWHKRWEEHRSHGSR